MYGCLKAGMRFLWKPEIRECGSRGRTASSGCSTEDLVPIREDLKAQRLPGASHPYGSVPSQPRYNLRHMASTHTTPRPAARGER